MEVLEQRAEIHLLKGCQNRQCRAFRCWSVLGETELPRVRSLAVQLQSCTNGGSKLFLDSLVLLCAFSAFFSCEVSRSAVETKASESGSPFSWSQSRGRELHASSLSPCSTGVGAIYVRRRPRVRLEPLQSGGGQERGLRSGTVPTPLAVGLGAACEVAQEEMEVRGRAGRALMQQGSFERGLRRSFCVCARERRWIKVTWSNGLWIFGVRRFCVTGRWVSAFLSFRLKWFESWLFTTLMIYGFSEMQLEVLALVSALQTYCSPSEAECIMLI